MSGSGLLRWGPATPVARSSHGNRGRPARRMIMSGRDARGPQDMTRHWRGAPLRALAVTSKQRHPGFPDVPSVAERLVPDYDVVSWLGFAAPAGLPPALRERLYEALRQAMARPEVKSKLEELGNDTRVSTPAEFRARVEADLARWRPLAHVVNQS